MASVEECHEALHRLAGQLAGVDAETRGKVVLDRVVSCRVPDLDVTFSGRLRDGGLHDIVAAPATDPQISLRVSSDDLVALSSGQLSFARAWASGRVRVNASITDLLRLRRLL